MTYTGTLAAAAVKVAASLGVHGTDSVILADGANVIVHLSPTPVVAKVAASTPAVRPDNAAWLQRELDVVRFLAGRGVPVMTPSPEIPPVVHHGDGQVMSFWRYLSRSGQGMPGEATIGSMLRDLHAELRDYPAQLPFLAPLGDIPAFLARPQTRLTAGQAAALAAAHARLTAQLDHGRGQSLHGDAGAGNLMATDAGWVWHDFEDTCTRPGGLGPGRLDGQPAPGRPAHPGRLRRAGGPSPARGLPAAQEAAPDRLVQPLCRTVAGSRSPRRRTPHPVAGALNPVTPARPAWSQRA